MTKIQNNKPEKNQHTGMTDRIRRAAAVLSAGFSRGEIFNRAEILVAEQNSFNRSWNDLRKRGELTKTGCQQYRYNDWLVPQADVKIRIYRAMHVKGAFCATDISKLCEAHISYVQAVIRRLVQNEDLEFTGKQAQVKFYRVRNSEKFYLEYVK